MRFSVLSSVLIVTLSVPSVAIFADDQVPSTPIVTKSGPAPESVSTSSVQTVMSGVSAPFEVDVTALFTNDISKMTFEELTNLLDVTRMELKDTSAGMPARRESEREAKTKAIKENPAIQDVRRQIDALKKQATDLAENDPGYVAAHKAMVDAQRNVYILSKKQQLLSKELGERDGKWVSATGTVTNMP
jgi:hypothetical protein